MLELSQGFMYRVAHGPEHPRLARALLLKAEFVLCFTRTMGMVWALLSCLMPDGYNGNVGSPCMLNVTTVGLVLD